MTQRTFAALNGVPILAFPGEAGWRFTPGVAPYVRDFTFPREIARKLIEGNRGASQSKLYLEGNGRKVEIKRLSILRSLPTDDPAYWRVRVADRRWLWAYFVFTRCYNKRVRGAATSRVGAGPQAVLPVVDTVGFQVWSLKDGQKAWEPRDVLQDVLDNVAGAGLWRDDNGALAKELTPVEDLEPVGTRADALAEVLGYFGEALDVWCDRDGIIRLIDRASGLDFRLFNVGTGTAGKRPQVTPGPGWVTQDRRAERPAKVRVLFLPLVEARIDRKEAEDADEGATRTRDQASRTREPLRADDMVYLPTDAQISGADLAAGSLVTLDEFLAYLDGRQPAGLPALTRDLIRQGWLSDLLNEYVALDDRITNLWALYVPAIRSAWRRRCQPRKAWRDRIRVMMAKRVAVLHQTTGTQGGADVFGDHAVEHTWRNPSGKRDDDLREVHEQFRNVYAAGSSGPGNIVGTPIRDLRRAPAVVAIRDQDQKVYEVDWEEGTEGDVQRLYRCAVEASTNPSQRLGDGSQFVHQADTEMQEDWEQSVVLTCVMGAPNDKRRFWAVEVEPSQVSSKIKHRIFPADGPPLEVLVSGARVPARFKWDDDRAEQFYDVFSEGSQANLVDALAGPINADQLQAVAESIAASIYLQLADRPVGGLRTPLVEVDLVGAAARVGYELDPAQGALTDILVPEDGLAVDPDAFLPQAVKRAIDFMVDP